MNFLIDAWDFNQHPAQAITNDDTVKSRPGCWFHFQRDVEGINEWLKAADIPEPIIDAMLEEDTRPRFQRLKDGFVLLLRGVNLNEGAQPEDMMSLRILYYKETVYTFRKHHFKAVAHIRDDLQNQQGPESLNDFLVHLVEQLNQKIEDVIDDIELNVEQMEAEGFDNTAEQQKKLAVMHRRLLRLNRFIRPQLAALDKFTSESEKWIDAELHQWLLNERDTTQRLLEQIDLMLEQVWMQREQIQQAVAEKMNRNTYWLSVIAGVFLPLSFLTGVFGINIGGMPGVENTSAFEIFCWILLGIAVVEFLLLRRLRFW
ncbi:zinc transporter ZntB [Idiomarina baltica]|uniref:Mg/Co transporter n=1 Tax=Idiomarina baltica OS145 TaxID=314276 RepID=A0ABP2CN83_9GAMM|nr:zinc transporter ZntB [Idiomarina baltica]EAQ31062.1 Mg/Co transporter [Idiomarina baltica OS145]